MPPQANDDPAEQESQDPALHDKQFAEQRGQEIGVQSEQEKEPVSDFRKETPVTPNPPLDPVAQKLKKARDAERANETPEQREAREQRVAAGEEPTGEPKGEETVESLLANKDNTREKLDEIARDAGVEDPEHLGSKRAVAEAIIEARSR